MRNLIFTIVFFILCVGCGVKNDPKYNSQNNYNKTTIII